jgi:hypothetical protein
MFIQECRRGHERSLQKRHWTYPCDLPSEKAHDFKNELVAKREPGALQIHSYAVASGQCEAQISYPMESGRPEHLVE